MVVILLTALRRIDVSCEPSACPLIAGIEYLAAMDSANDVHVLILSPWSAEQRLVHIVALPAMLLLEQLSPDFILA
jgi:hypothetical protein